MEELIAGDEMKGRTRGREVVRRPNRLASSAFAAPPQYARHRSFTPSSVTRRSFSTPIPCYLENEGKKKRGKYKLYTQQRADDLANPRYKPGAISRVTRINPECDIYLFRAERFLHVASYRSAAYGIVKSFRLVHSCTVSETAE